MKINIIHISKKSGEYEDKISDYAKRIEKYTDLEFTRIEPCKDDDSNVRIKKESEIILEKIKSSDYVVLLEENGSDLNSLEFAAFIDDKQNNSIKRLVFIVGGAYGVSKEIQDRANYILRLGKMVWPHELARLMITEQIYRSFSILSDLPYHHK